MRCAIPGHSPYYYFIVHFIHPPLKLSTPFHPWLALTAILPAVGQSVLSRRSESIWAGTFRPTMNHDHAQIPLVDAYSKSAALGWDT